VRELNRMRLGVLKEIKSVRRFLDMMEKNVRSREPSHTLRAYTFLTILVEHMNEGDLTPFNVDFIQTMREHCGDHDGLDIHSQDS